MEKILLSTTSYFNSCRQWSWFCCQLSYLILADNGADSVVNYKLFISCRQWSRFCCQLSYSISCRQWSWFCCQLKVIYFMQTMELILLSTKLFYFLQTMEQILLSTKLFYFLQTMELILLSTTSYSISCRQWRRFCCQLSYLFLTDNGADSVVNYKLSAPLSARNRITCSWQQNQLHCLQEIE